MLISINCWRAAKKRNCPKSFPFWRSGGPKLLNCFGTGSFPGTGRIVGAGMELELHNLPLFVSAKSGLLQLIAVGEINKHEAF